jgi:LPXTG-motif cell wall-anchored protein
MFLALGVPAAQVAAQSVPVIMSENVQLITNFPDTLMISAEFAQTGDYLYTSSLDSVSAFDVSDPRDPQLLDTIINATFENESMTYGERLIGGTLRRFVIVGFDQYNVNPLDIEHLNVGGQAFMLVDVTDPNNIVAGTPVNTTLSTHTVQCVNPRNCKYAYTAGTDGQFEIIDITDPDAPTVLKVVDSPASGPGLPAFGGGAGHYWDFDTNQDIGWHTGSGGAAAFDVSDPANPKPIQATNAEGLKTPYNDFILHNTRRPNPGKFKAGTAPDVDKGNVLLVTEEDYANDGEEIICEQQNGNEAGTFQTWYIPDLNGQKYRANNPSGAPSKGTIKPLDIVNAPAEFGENAPLHTPVGVFCSGHWFDYHQDGIVAEGYYQQGMWLQDVTDAKNIKYYGYYTPLVSEIWDAYWVPKRDADGHLLPEKTNILYTADAVRGLDVLEVDVPSTGGGPAPDVNDNDGNGNGNGNGNGDGNGNDGDDSGVGDTGGEQLPATGGTPLFVLLGAGLLAAAALLSRRRRA